MATNLPDDKVDFNLCIICQRKGNADYLVEKPTSHEKVLGFIKEWAKYGQLKYSEVWKKLECCSLEKIVEMKASWHRSCYKDAVHVGMLKRAKQRYERQLEGHDESRRKSLVDLTGESPQLTRSKTSPYDRNVCFFCNAPATYRKTLHNVSTSSAGESLQSAIKKSGNDKLSVKLNTAIGAGDAHAIDIKYHKTCWARNVTNVIRSTASDSEPHRLANEVAARIEFLTLAEMTLKSGNIATMSELQTAFESIREANNVPDHAYGRKSLKLLLLREIPEIEFHAPKRVNESERVSLKQTRDSAIQTVEEQSENMDSELKTLFDAASILRRSIQKCKKWEFTGSLENFSDVHLPTELLSFYRWIIQGPKTELAVQKKSEEVYKRAMNLAQATVSMCLTERQAKNPKSEALRSISEMPQQLAVGLAVHQAVRSKELIKMLHGFRMSVDYSRVLRVETQIESTVLKHMADNDGLYIPPDVVMGRHIFFAADNVDFSEDTPDGKNTFHGTAMAIYQRQETEDQQPDLTIDSSDQCSRSIRELPETVTNLLECPTPPAKPVGPSYPEFQLLPEAELPAQAEVEDYVWLFGRSLSRCPVNRQAEEEFEEEDLVDRSTSVPVWSAYNSTFSDAMPMTRVGNPPLIAAPAHEWNTLLTVLMQAQHITTKVVGPDRKTVISLDMGLYQPAKKLQMSRRDLGHVILRPGELHIVMAQLRSIGAFIENSGLDMCWIESDLFGPATVKQILGGNHVKRGLSAHLITVQSLFEMYQEALFSENPTLRTTLAKPAKDLSEAFSGTSTKQMKAKHDSLVQTVESTEIIKKIQAFDAKREDVPMFQFTRQYMKMVLEMMSFIKAVRIGDWDLHLEALELFAKYFFTHDMLNYARMIPVYLAELKMLKTTSPDIYEEVSQGNWVVNKNKIPFCAVGADNALEHVNRSMKVSGGLVGITLNATARTKYFLIAPELARLAQQAKDMAGTTAKAPTRHHDFTIAARSREEKSVQKLLRSIKRFADPFVDQSSDLFNLVTKVVMPKKVKEDVCDQSSIGKELLTKYTKERIQSSKLSIWATMKKRKLATWKTTGKTVRVSSKDRVFELKENRSLFARMMVVCKSRPEIDIKEAIGKYEFTVVPRSMFAADGTLLHCPMKSSLMDILEKLPGDKTAQPDERPALGVQMKVSIVDGMAELQALDKPDWIRNCAHLADHFTRTILDKYRDADELRLIFDRYDVSLSLKTATRVSRQGGQDPVHYKITNTTHIAKVPLKRLLSHVETKKELTEYLAGKTLEKGHQQGACVVVTWSSKCRGTHKEMAYLDSDHEEADTKIILHAVDATASGATSIEIHSPDTDVFVLALRRYPELCEDTCFITGRGQRHRKIHLSPIVCALGPSRTAALPGFHAWSGADVTGSFAFKGKLECWKAFLDADEECVTALTDLGSGIQPAPATLLAIEKLVCKLYLPKTTIASLTDLRWLLFRRKQAQSERLPPTQATLRVASLRAHYQAMVWANDKIPNPEIPSPENYGWTLNGGQWMPVMTTIQPAPDAVLHLVKCGCIKDRCSTNRCTCRKAGLNCTDLCSCCSDTDDACENVNQPNEGSDGEDDDEEDYEDYDHED